MTHYTLCLVLVSAALTGCATKPVDPIKVSLETSSTKVYDKKNPVNTPPPLPGSAYGNEELYAPNNGPQPIIHQPQIMVIGQTAQRDPNNPNVYRGGRMDYVVVEDWRWNEDALRKGAEIQIPDPGPQAGIEELRVISSEPVSPQNPAPTTQSKVPTLIDDLSTPPAAELPAVTPTSPPPGTNVAPANLLTTLPMEVPQTCPESFAAFLANEGKGHGALRKSLRTLQCPDKKDYDRALKEMGPAEQLGFIPNFGWVAFQIKTWHELTKEEQNKWLTSQPYLHYAAIYDRHKSKLTTREAQNPTVTEGTRLQPPAPLVLEVDLQNPRPDGVILATPPKAN